MTIMHDNEIFIDIVTVKHLINTQCPDWAGLPIKPLQSMGTDNRMYKIGCNMVMRLPRTTHVAASVDVEYALLSQLVPCVPCAIPEPLYKGAPDEVYPWPWAVYRWIEGDNLFEKYNTNESTLALDLGNFVRALHRINTTNGPRAPRGFPLGERDQSTRAALEALQGTIDTNAAEAAWESVLSVCAWDGPPVWVHGDLHAGNILIKDGRINGIIDFGMAGIGDPACDMMVAWTFLSQKVRHLFRSTVQVDNATWARGRGWALTFGLVALPYYQHTNRVLAGIAQSTIEAVLADISVECDRLK